MNEFYNYHEYKEIDLDRGDTDYYIDDLKPIVDLHPIFEMVQRPNSIGNYQTYLVKYIKYAIQQAMRDPNQLELFKGIDKIE